MTNLDKFELIENSVAGKSLKPLPEYTNTMYQWYPLEDVYRAFRKMIHREMATQRDAEIAAKAQEIPTNIIITAEIKEK